MNRPPLIAAKKQRKKRKGSGHVPHSQRDSWPRSSSDQLSVFTMSSIIYRTGKVKSHTILHFCFFIDIYSNFKLTCICLVILNRVQINSPGRHCRNDSTGTILCMYIILDYYVRYSYTIYIAAWVSPINYSIYLFKFLVVPCLSNRYFDVAGWLYLISHPKKHVQIIFRNELLTNPRLGPTPRTSVIPKGADKEDNDW